MLYTVDFNKMCSQNFFRAAAKVCNLVAVFYTILLFYPVSFDSTQPRKVPNIAPLQCSFTMENSWWTWCEPFPISHL